MTEKKEFKYLVIGDPVGHSLSPEMQNAAFRFYDMGEPYSKLRVTESEFPDFIEYARIHLDGFNITVPHKKMIIPFLDSISTAAKLAESVNTVTVNNGKLYGDSTDGYGLATAIKEVFGFDIPGNSFFFIGCGGAVQATAFYFAASGAKTLYFANRNQDKVESLTARLRQAFPSGDFVCCSLTDTAQISGFVQKSQVAIQGTSLGLKDSDEMPVPVELLRNICFYETIYRPTPLLRIAKANGLNVADGHTMLLHQGAKSFETWTGCAAPVEVMRKSLTHAMASRGGRS